MKKNYSAASNSTAKWVEETISRPAADVATPATLIANMINGIIEDKFFSPRAMIKLGFKAHRTNPNSFIAVRKQDPRYYDENSLYQEIAIGTYAFELSSDDRFANTEKPFAIRNFVLVRFQFTDGNRTAVNPDTFEIDMGTSDDGPSWRKFPSDYDFTDAIYETAVHKSACSSNSNYTPRADDYSMNITFIMEALAYNSANYLDFKIGLFSNEGISYDNDTFWQQRVIGIESPMETMNYLDILSEMLNDLRRKGIIAAGRETCSAVGMQGGPLVYINMEKVDKDEQYQIYDVGLDSYDPNWKLLEGFGITSLIRNHSFIAEFIRVRIHYDGGDSSKTKVNRMMSGEPVEIFNGQDWVRVPSNYDLSTLELTRDAITVRAEDPEASYGPEDIFNELLEVATLRLGRAMKINAVTSNGGKTGGK